MTIDPGWVEPMLHLTSGGRTTVRYRCACGYVSQLCYASFPNCAERELIDHLAADHGYGPPGTAGHCAECGAPTGHFHAAAAGVGEQWLCARHAPSLPTILDQGEGS